MPECQGGRGEKKRLVFTFFAGICLLKYYLNDLFLKNCNCCNAENIPIIFHTVNSHKLQWLIMAWSSTLMISIKRKSLMTPVNCEALHWNGTQGSLQITQNEQLSLFTTHILQQKQNIFYSCSHTNCICSLIDQARLQKIATDCLVGMGKETCDNRNSDWRARQYI